MKGLLGFKLQTVFAYIVPGSTSFILQLIIGALIGGVCAVKLFWHQVKSWFKNIFGKKEQ